LISFRNVSPKGLPFLFVVSPPLPSFKSYFVVFHSTLIGVLEKLLGLGSLEHLEALLILGKWLFHSDGGRGLTSLEVIALVTYLKSWALIDFIIIFRFLLDSHSFLLEVIGVN